jgi:hypothetical protein
MSRTPQIPVLLFSLRALLPDMQSFWPAEKLAEGSVITVTLLRQCAIYTVLYTAGILCLGLASFRNRQF